MTQGIVVRWPASPRFCLNEQPRSLTTTQSYVVSPNLVLNFGLNRLACSLEEQDHRIVAHLDPTGHYYPRSGQSGCTLSRLIVLSAFGGMQAVRCRSRCSCLNALSPVCHCSNLKSIREKNEFAKARSSCKACLALASFTVSILVKFANRQCCPTADGYFYSDWHTRWIRCGHVFYAGRFLGWITA